MMFEDVRLRWPSTRSGFGYRSGAPPRSPTVGNGRRDTTASGPTMHRCGLEGNPSGSLIRLNPQRRAPKERRGCLIFNTEGLGK